MTVSHLPYMLGNLFKTLINHSLDVSERPENEKKKIVLYTYYVYQKISFVLYK